MSLQIDTSNSILIDEKDTGLKVVQRREGTCVYSPELPRRQDVVKGEMVWLEKQSYQEHQMPHARYLLGSDSPITNPGVATRAQFEADIRALLRRI